MASSSAGLGTGLGGLVNVGLTCYANAVIQCLRQTKKLPWICQPGHFSSLFEDAGTVKGKRRVQQELTAAFADVIQLLGKCEKGQSVRPGEFWKRVTPAVEGTLYEHLASREPHDSHEFYLFILQTLHEATATEVEMKVLRPTPQTEQDHLIIRAIEAWKKEFTKEYSPFVDIFYGLGHWQTTCQRCSTTTHRWESFNSLEISIPVGPPAGGPLRVSDLLEAHGAPETIEKYDCDTCKEKTTVKRKYTIWRLPHTTVLIFKRFKYTGEKICTPVATLENGGLDFAPYFSEQSPEKAGTTLYKLRSIVDHHGSSRGGHYTAQIQPREGIDWYLCDDEGIIHMNGKGPIFGESTYMLFLERS